MIDFHFVTSRRKTVLILLAICGLALLPFLGIADFNTKGEPREAVVAFSILEQENWILPTNNGGEIPYKPPFLHWCIAAVSLLLNGGIVNEYTSRLPSAIALIAMTATIFLFFSKKSQNKTALGTALLMFTAFEIYRAGMNCRVDMMLTALTVGAIVSLFRWWERGMRGFPVIAILLMSAATLTKGPVGIIIPCLTAGIFMLLRGVPFFKAFIWLSLWGVLSLILPLCWYLAAYQQGGKEFLDLVMEENFGRMTGTMAYESHLNPWYYNIVTLLAGFLPWTITAVIALFVIPRHAYSEIAGRLHDISGRLRRWLRETSPRTLLALTAVIVIFIFYCIPASKRSVSDAPLSLYGILPCPHADVDVTPETRQRKRIWGFHSCHRNSSLRSLHIHKMRTGTRFPLRTWETCCAKRCHASFSQRFRRHRKLDMGRGRPRLLDNMVV